MSENIEKSSLRKNNGTLQNLSKLKTNSDSVIPIIVILIATIIIKWFIGLRSRYQRIKILIDFNVSKVSIAPEVVQHFRCKACIVSNFII